MRFPSPRILRFVPLVFLVGPEAFTMFAPYVMLLLAAAYVVRRMRTEPQSVPVIANSL